MNVLLYSPLGSLIEADFAFPNLNRPFEEVHGGSSAMQAFAGVCAPVVASTLLQHTALRGIIESERLDRLDRVWYKSRYLVSSSLSAHFDLSVLCLKSVFDLNAYF